MRKLIKWISYRTLFQADRISEARALIWLLLFKCGGQSEVKCARHSQKVNRMPIRKQFFFFPLSFFSFFLASLVAQLVKNPPAVLETWVLSLGWEDPLKKGKASVFWSGEFHGLYSLRGRKELDRTEQLSLSLSIHLGIF